MRITIQCIGILSSNCRVMPVTFCVSPFGTQNLFCKFSISCASDFGFTQIFCFLRKRICPATRNRISRLTVAIGFLASSW